MFTKRGRCKILQTREKNSWTARLQQITKSETKLIAAQTTPESCTETLRLPYTEYIIRVPSRDACFVATPPPPPPIKYTTGPPELQMGSKGGFAKVANTAKRRNRGRITEAHASISARCGCGVKYSRMLDCAETWALFPSCKIGFD